MIRFRELWQRLPERLRDYAVRVALWLVLVGAGWAIGRLTGTRVEPVPFPVYVQVEAPEPIVTMVAFGWVEDRAAVQAVAATLPFKVFGDTPAGQAADELPKAVYLWHAYRSISGVNPPPKDQNPIGSCVSFGTNTAIERTMAVEIAIKKEREEFHFIAEEVTYAGSRVEIGGGRIGGDGSVGAWAAQFVQKWGVVSREKHLTYDLSKYDPNRCRAWGRSGVPDDLEPLAREHPVKDITQIKSWADAKRALANGYGIAICSNQGFAMQRDARGVCRASGSWAHCMALDGYHTDTDGREYGHIENSWGANAHTGPVGWGEPSTAGFWAESSTIDRMLKQDDSWAFSAVKGFPRAKRVIDWFVQAHPENHFVDANKMVPANPLYIASEKRYNDRRKANEPEFALAP